MRGFQFAWIKPLRFGPIGEKGCPKIFPGLFLSGEELLQAEQFSLKMAQKNNRVLKYRNMQKRPRSLKVKFSIYCPHLCQWNAKQAVNPSLKAKQCDT